MEGHESADEYTFKLNLAQLLRLRVTFYTLERLRFTFTPNGRREFVPRDQVFPLFSIYLFITSTQK